MDLIQLASAVGVGALLTKVLDIIWLQKVTREAERRKWLRDQRLKVFSELSKEALTFGLHKKDQDNAFRTLAISAEAMLLIPDAKLAERIDSFSIALFNFNDSIEKINEGKAAEGSNRAEYDRLWNEARDIVADLRSFLLEAETKSFWSCFKKSEA